MSFPTHVIRPPLDPVAAAADDYLKVHCPWCYADIGEPCMDSDQERLARDGERSEVTYFGQPLAVHPHRTERFLELRRSVLGRYMIMDATQWTPYRVGEVVYAVEDSGWPTSLLVFRAESDDAELCSLTSTREATLIEFTSERPSKFAYGTPGVRKLRPMGVKDPHERFRGK